MINELAYSFLRAAKTIISDVETEYAKTGLGGAEAETEIINRMIRAENAIAFAISGMEDQLERSKKMDKLKPCPFCGGKAKLIYKMPYSIIGCRECKALGVAVIDSYEQGDSKPKAAEAWNRRKENWIDAKNALPIPYNTVLVITDYGGYGMAHVGFNGEWLEDDDSPSEDEITHWMSLPDYPKQNKKEDEQ